MSLPDPVFPQEILDSIVGFVEDSETLLACCLSSRALLHVGTKRTFRHLVIRKDTYDDILRELANSPLKASAVRRVKFSASENPGLIHPSVDLSQQAAILMHLTALQHLSLDSLAFTIHTPTTLPFQDCKASQIVTQLTLTGAQFDTPIQILALFNAFPQLQYLTMHSTFWKYGYIHAVQDELNKMVPPFTLPKLRALRATTTDSSIVPFLLRDESIQRLEVLELDANDLESTRSRSLLVSKPDVVHSNLLHITIHGFTVHFRQALRTLPMAPNLQSLTLKDLLIRPKTPMQLGHGMYIRHFLLGVSGSGVEELFFEFLFVRLTEFAEFAVSEWLPCLHDDKFAKLSRVVYTFSGDALIDSRAEIEAHIRDAHGAWDRRGIIEVVVKGRARAFHATLSCTRYLLLSSDISV
ncbi:hypothetical protein BC835DRAFT_1411834 [Cytidiella melzeri]|nr:hypothetical protein BC835DRAFT_1411834 [Cytidiella melzeri]